MTDSLTLTICERDPCFEYAQEKLSKAEGKVF